MPDIEEMGLPRAAQELRLSWHAAYALVLTGRLTGRNVNGRWKVTAASVYEEKVRRGLVEPQQSAA